VNSRFRLRRVHVVAPPRLISCCQAEYKYLAQRVILNVQRGDSVGKLARLALARRQSSCFQARTDSAPASPVSQSKRLQA
jgi:hypothetical protein